MANEIVLGDPRLPKFREGSAMRALEIGGGTHKLEGAVQVDCVNRFDIDALCRWGRESLPFLSNTFDLVYASHCLEHVDYHDTHFALTEAFRVLRPGGAIELWVPNFAYFIETWQKAEGFLAENWKPHPPDDGWLPVATPSQPTYDLMYWINARIFNYAKDGDENHLHHAVFDEGYLRRCLERAGFVKPWRLEKTRTRDHYKIQLGIGAVKP